MSEQTHGYCARCECDVEVERHHPLSLRRKLKLYLYAPVILVPVFPFIAFDYVFALPIFMLYMLGIGPVLVIVREPAVCCACGALVANNARTIVATSTP